MKAKIAARPVFFSVTFSILVYVAYITYIAIFSADYGSVNIFGWGIYSHGDLFTYTAMRAAMRFVFSIPVILLMGLILQVNGFKFTFGLKGFKAALPIMIPAFLFMAISALRVINIAEINIYQVQFLPYVIPFQIGTGVFEEVLFRGLLMTAALHRFGGTKKGRWAVVLISSFLFGLAHFPGGVDGIFHATLGGIYFAALYVHSKNLLSCIVVHSFWNIALGVVRGLSWGIYHSEAWAEVFELAPDIIRVVVLTAVAIIVINKSKPFSGKYCEYGEADTMQSVS